MGEKFKLGDNEAGSSSAYKQAGNHLCSTGLFPPDEQSSNKNLNEALNPQNTHAYKKRPALFSLLLN